MRTPLRLAVVLTVVLLAASACALSGESAESSSSPSPPSASPSTPDATGTGTASASPSPTGTGSALPDDIRPRPTVVAAIDDTASREGVPPEQVVVAAWSPVTWTDGSLGCPQEGMSYTQALVEGELLILRVGAELFQYHARTGGPFTHCATPTAGYTVGG